MSVNVSDVLHQVNAIRVACGGNPLNDLAKGGHSANSCPLANSLKDLLPGIRVGGGLSGVPRNRAYAVAAVVDGVVSSINGRADVKAPLFDQFVNEFDSRKNWALRRYEV